MKVRIDEGAGVFEALDDRTFRAEWTRLWERCPFRTIFAHPDFVEGWLRFQGDRVRPILMTNLEEGRPRGVIALCERSGDLEVAGGTDVPVHGWLAEPLRGSFLLEALLVQAPRRQRLRLSLPPGAPRDWLGPGRPVGRLAETGRIDRRVVPLDPARAERPLDKKKNVSQLPRLKALGELSLEEEEGDLPTFVAWHDRKRHHRGLQPSLQRDRLGLYRRLDPSVLFTTVLRAGEQILSAMIVYRDGARAWLELLAENPEHEQHSPGLVHLFLLEERLLAEGVRTLDVTRDDDWMHLLAEEEVGVQADLLFSRRRRLQREAIGVAVRAGRRVLGR